MTFEPSTQFSQSDLEASNKKPVYVAVAVGFALATGSVILRGVARHMSKASFGWDDYTILLALILLYGLDITGVLNAAKYGLGQHLPAVLSTVVPFQKTSIANLALWLAIGAATKTSLLLLYYRLFSPSRRFSIAVYIGAAIIICQWLSLTLANIFQCRPVSAFWNRKIQGAECINLASFGIVTGVLNFSTDVLILCLPVPMVWGLNTNNAQKVTLTGIFLLGVFVCVTSIVRISKLAALNTTTGDPTWHLVDVYVWTTLESSVGITSACLPTMRPLFGNLFHRSSNAGSSNKKSGGSTHQHAAKAQFNRLIEEPKPGFLSRRAPKEDEEAWTSPDLAGSNELLSVDKIPRRPPVSKSFTTRKEAQQYQAGSSQNVNHW